METAVGLSAAFFTTISYIPQLLKVWRTRAAGDLSLKMLATLATGLALWVVYGVMRSDLAIVVANSISISQIGFIAYFKIAEPSAPGSRPRD
jgi:MtN3 and saliva related transmembrane protein